MKRMGSKNLANGTLKEALDSVLSAKGIDLKELFAEAYQSYCLAWGAEPDKYEPDRHERKVIEALVLRQLKDRGVFDDVKKGLLKAI